MTLRQAAFNVGLGALARSRSCSRTRPSRSALRLSAVHTFVTERSDCATLSSSMVLMPGSIVTWRD
jgi:hypothetical protein